MKYLFDTLQDLLDKKRIYLSFINKSLNVTVDPKVFNEVTFA